MKIVLIQAGNFKFYYGRYKSIEAIPDKQSMRLDDNKDIDSVPYIEIPIFITQPYNSKGPKEDKSIDSVWESQTELDKISLQTLQSSSYGSKHLVRLLLVSLGFREIETKEGKKNIEIYSPGQEELAYKESDAIDRVLKGNMM